MKKNLVKLSNDVYVDPSNVILILRKKDDISKCVVILESFPHPVNSDFTLDETAEKIRLASGALLVRHRTEERDDV